MSKKFKNFMLKASAALGIMALATGCIRQEYLVNIISEDEIVFAITQELQASYASDSGASWEDLCFFNAQDADDLDEGTVEFLEEMQSRASVARTNDPEYVGCRTQFSITTEELNSLPAELAEGFPTIALADDVWSFFMGPEDAESSYTDEEIEASENDEDIEDYVEYTDETDDVGMDFDADSMLEGLVTFNIAVQFPGDVIQADANATVQGQLVHWSGLEDLDGGIWALASNIPTVIEEVIPEPIEEEPVVEEYYPEEIIEEPEIEEIVVLPPPPVEEVIEEEEAGLNLLLIGGAAGVVVIIAVVIIILKKKSGVHDDEDNDEEEEHEDSILDDLTENYFDDEE